METGHWDHAKDGTGVDAQIGEYQDFKGGKGLKNSADKSKNVISDVSSADESML